MRALYTKSAAAIREEYKMIKKNTLYIVFDRVKIMRNYINSTVDGDKIRLIKNAKWKSDCF